MLRSVLSLNSSTIIANDGEIGICKDIYFDDIHLSGRYIIVDTGNWLPGRKVLVPTMKSGQVGENFIVVSMSRKEVKDSPDIDTDRPVSRQHERSIYNYYHWPLYWEETAYMVPPPIAPAIPLNHDMTENPEEETHLRSCKEVTGYKVTTTTDTVGHIEDFVFDITNWKMKFVVVDTADWVPGSRKVLIVPKNLKSINWTSGQIALDISREQVLDAPEYNPTDPVNKVFVERITDYYGHLQV